jgi:antitoxin component of MazEF toxin-antitoxin module
MKFGQLEVFTNEDGDAVVQLPDQMIQDLNWKEGDELHWDIKENGSVILSKVEKSVNTEWVLVETVQMFRHRYCIEVPIGKAEWALDTVTMEEAKEFSQLHLGETISSHRVISEEEAVKLCYSDNDYLKSWTPEKIKTAFFTPMKE